MKNICIIGISSYLAVVAAAAGDFLKMKYYRDSGCNDLYAVTFTASTEFNAGATCSSLLSVNNFPINTCVPTNASNAFFNTYSKATCQPSFSFPDDGNAAFSTNKSWIAITNSRESTCTQNIGAVAYLADGSCVLKPDYKDFNLIESYKYTISNDGNLVFQNYTGTRDCTTANPIIQTFPNAILNGKICLLTAGLYVSAWYNKPSSFNPGSNTSSILTTPTQTPKPSFAVPTFIKSLSSIVIPLLVILVTYC